ncbi:MAG: GNAT family N-acetyltransferase, partial [Sphingosinicella sp.]
MTVNIALFDHFDQVAADAAGALDRAAQPCLFHRLDWFQLIAAHCPPKGRLRVIRAEQGGRKAWLFLAIESGRARAFAAWYSLRFDAVGNRASDVMTAMAATLRDGGIASVELAPLEDPAPLAEAFRAAGWSVQVSEKTGNWRIATDGMDFAAYWASRPGQLRSTFKRRGKAAHLKIEIYDRFDEDAWADYEAVYRASWKPDEGSFAFLRALAEQEGEAGTLRLGIAR